MQTLKPFKNKNNLGLHVKTGCGYEYELSVVILQEFVI